MGRGQDHGSDHPEHRLFLALWPDPATRARLQAWSDQFVWPSNLSRQGTGPARRVAAADLHLTLHFIGQFPVAQTEALAQALALDIEHQHAAPLGPIVLQFGQLTRFHQGITVIEPLDVPAALTELHTRTNAVLRRFGWQGETPPRSYRPHITLARRADLAIAPEQPLSLQWRADQMALVVSDHGYRCLHSFDLG